MHAFLSDGILSTYVHTVNQELQPIWINPKSLKSRCKKGVSQNGTIDMIYFLTVIYTFHI